jgi:hypothetical protein
LDLGRGMLLLQAWFLWLFVSLDLFLGFLGRKILLYLVGFCVFGYVEGV